jgi:hypothetical protein
LDSQNAQQIVLTRHDKYGGQTIRKGLPALRRVVHPAFKDNKAGDLAFERRSDWQAAKEICATKTSPHVGADREYSACRLGGTGMMKVENVTYFRRLGHGLNELARRLLTAVRPR